MYPEKNIGILPGCVEMESGNLRRRWIRIWQGMQRIVTRTYMVRWREKDFKKVYLPDT